MNILHSPANHRYSVSFLKSSASADQKQHVLDLEWGGGKNLWKVIVKCFYDLTLCCGRKVQSWRVKTTVYTPAFFKSTLWYLDASVMKGELGRKQGRMKCSIRLEQCPYGQILNYSRLLERKC